MLIWEGNKKKICYKKKYDVIPWVRLSIGHRKCLGYSAQTGLVAPQSPGYSGDQLCT